jgi:hypothetical protein
MPCKTSGGVAVIKVDISEVEVGEKKDHNDAHNATRAAVDSEEGIHSGAYSKCHVVAVSPLLVLYSLPGALH